jgi:hypothetical protein
VNPYQSPASTPDYPPFWIRFRHRVQRAMRAYNAHLVEEHVSAVEHIGAWISLFFIAFFFLIGTCILVVALIHGLRG